MSFYDSMQNQLDQRKTLTQNGAIAYETSGKALLDFNFAVTALRSASEKEITEMFSRAFYEEPHVAVKFLFWLRDCRGGNGERRIFRVCLIWLADLRPEIARAIVNLVPDYGRWDDLWVLLDGQLKQEVIDFVGKQLDADNEAIKQGKSLSLVAKWVPSINASSRETKRLARIFMNAWNVDERKYRKTLSYLRKHLELVESKMSANEWSEIRYEAVPSKANLIYKNAFMRHDEERRTKYLESLKKGETKINAGVLQPHEIVRKYGYALDDTLEEMWKALPDLTIGNTLVVRDGSGSMTWGCGSDVLPIDVATALAIYMADHNDSVWAGKFITFSSSPRIVDISKAVSLKEKLNICNRETDCSNTNIEATMMLVLNTAVRNHCKQEEMPSKIVIVSDMQFDDLRGRYSRVDNDLSTTLFESIAQRFVKAGYKMPKIIFWNVSGSVNQTIPMQENELGVVLCSGFSVQLMKMVMSGKTDPYDVLLETINVPRYGAVDEALKGIV